VNNPLLELREVSAGYGDSEILFDINMTVGHDNIVALFGRNGMGKTTLLRTIINQVIDSKSGTVLFSGTDVSDWSTYRLSREGIAYVPEDRSIYPNLTVEENLKIGIPRNVGEEEAEARVDQMYNHFSRLADRRRQAGGTLSGGEQQMLAIARALVSEPDLLLLDEPTEGLAPMIIEEVVDIINQIASDNRSILLVEQSINRMLPVIDYGYIIEDGCVVFQGESEKLSDESVQKKYLTV
jgi:branched-chain amino acid transport system ATP-binding protein